ncbi:MAG: DNA polymerase I [Defluviitaleaceae bacterium]|nr:DNA polymerase I [Defluviitaleaceae bacterium]
MKNMKILLFDGYSILNRAFYGLPLLTNSSGEYTNAVYGFLNMFFRFMDEEKPDFVTVAFDLPQPTFRHEMYGAYKGTRKGMPDELRAQVPILKTLLEKMGIPMSSCEGYEADDVLGTLSVKATQEGMSTVIITGDRDMLQLANENVTIRLPKTKAGKTEVEDYNAEKVFEKYGVTPNALIDIKALMGDTSDNIPGVPSIGEVTATKIILAYGSLENALSHIDEIKPKKASENLAQFRDQAILSRALAEIALNAPIELELRKVENMWNENARAEVKRLELKSLYRKFEKGAEMSERDKSGAATANKNSNAETHHSETKPSKPTETSVIKLRKDAESIFERLMRHNAGVGFFPIWNTDGAHGEAPFLIGIAMATPKETLLHIATCDSDLTITNHTDGDITEADLLTLAKPWLESDRPKWVYDAKSEIMRFSRYGIILQGVTFDAMLAAYVLDAMQENNGISDIALNYLNETVITLEELLDNKGKRSKDRKTISDLPQPTVTEFATQYANIIARACPLMESQLAANNQTELFRNMELPLAFLLAEMESTGIKVSKSILTDFGAEMDNRLSALTNLIHDLAGEQFNINSPAQLGEILFGKFGLKGGKKTTKGYSTAADVLEKLSDKHPIVPLVLEYRAHAKLKSTYVDGMLPLIHPKTSRIHSTFHQALTATGRLSSAEPNLQNIPVRTQLGRELRKAFVPKEGHIFLDADYSQIELRLLAHISGDSVLINAFRENQDIHRLTASQVLGVNPEDVTPEQRNNAKAVNFGIIYGISAFGLSADLKIPVKEAESYIKGYFEKYPDVKAYLDETIERAKSDGFVSTLYNRRRALPELKSPNFNTRSFGERVAMNMPIQGTAADIIKLAMLNVDAQLKAQNLNTKIVLQVHDELLLEAPTEELNTVKHILKHEMEKVAALEVPLAADVNVGESWYATK